MPQTLLARLTITEQYNKATKTVTYSDDKINRWQKVYSNLGPGDNGIFISTTNVLVGTFVSAVPDTSMTFNNVVELAISNDQLLQLDEIHPEYIAMVKANFNPFIHRKQIDINALIDSANNKRFVNYYIVNGRSYVEQNLASFKRNDRFIILENGTLTEALKYASTGLIELQNPSGFAVKDFSLSEVLKMHKARKEEGNNVRRIENIISTLQTQPFYKFTSFFAYHDAITNNRVYGTAIDLDAEAESNPNQPLAMDISSLNTILFGPPGTGKTYHTINAAVQVCDPQFYEGNKYNRTALRKRFQELLIDWKQSLITGQVAFCTFHQSFSYEDFVEGIKPQKPEDGDRYLKYDIQEGIFKKICTLAADNLKASNLKNDRVISMNDETFKKAVFYKISLGNSNKDEDLAIYEYCIKNNCIALGYGGEIDFTGLDEEQIAKKYKSLEKESFAEQAVNRFIHYIKVGNYILVGNGNHYVRAIGKVTGNYFYDPNTAIRFRHFRSVEWLVKDENIPIAEVYDRALSQQTIYKLDEDGIKKEFFVNTGRQSTSKAKDVKNFVLIIDEINRGNVSSIFGELITLIEKDKRAGAPEELEVVLPYSKDVFKVPANVYIIGTMNTADRSIEALDTALRRRFSFKEMPPRADLLSPQYCIWELFWKYIDVEWHEEPYKSKEDAVFNFIGVPAELESRKKEIWLRMLDEKAPGTHQVEWLADFKYTGLRLDHLLNRINERIEKLLDKDHRIGHSYFLGVSSIEETRDAFRDKVIPLLQEYFFGDYGKIGLVLGNSFIEKVKTENFAFAKFDGYDPGISSDLKERPVFTITDPSRWDFKSIYA